MMCDNCKEELVDENYGFKFKGKIYCAWCILYFNRKLKYGIHIKPAVGAWKKDGYKFSVGLTKNFGNCSSSYGGAKDREALLDKIKHMLDRWRQYDSILERVPDSVTERNTAFLDETDTVTIKELLENTRQLTCFFEE